MAGMSSSIVDEELHAMLQSSDELLHSPAQTALASVMALASSPAGIIMMESTAGGGLAADQHILHSSFSSQYSSLQGGFSSSGGPARLLQQPAAASARPGMNMAAMEASSNVLLQAAAAGVPNNRSMPLLQQQQPLWPSSLSSFNNNDEQQKSELEAKIRVMKIAANVRGNSNSRFRPTSDATSLQGLNPPPAQGPPFAGGGLQRYHSAPSSLLQNLADEVAAFSSQVSSSSSPLGNSNVGNRPDGLNESHIPSFFSGNNLTPITEGVPQPMETDKLPNASTSHNPYNPFLSPLTETEKHQQQQQQQSSLVTTTSMFGVQQDSVPAAKRLGNKPRPPKVNLFRQSSLPADWLADLKDGGGIGETDPGPQIPSMTSSPDESFSGGMSEVTGAGGSGKASMYSRDDSFFLSDTSSGGLWNSLPSSAGLSAGKWLRGVLSDSITDTGVPGEGSLRGGGVREPGTLIRHSSLPATMNRPTSLGFDDLANISVPCRARAKRGCATHPRSIAERIRRTKITERMKRLQDLVPNMDKQTNTSDMLDEAVEYVKQLKQKVQGLSDTVVQLREMQQVKGSKAAQGQGSSQL